ncbi:MAG: IS110 family transposase [Candidatus Omnitrophica bacterium]|nr:IS110 family transposase [Candidatus Omnitrophota bacterium]
MIGVYLPCIQEKKSMYYLGIDIGKKFHEACLVNQKGEIIIAPFRFSNTRLGFNLLREKISAFPVKDCLIGMEATGHYWLNLYSELKKDYLMKVINPLQSDSLRNLYLRKVKTDKKDCLIITDLLRIGNLEETGVLDPRIRQLRQLSRFRYELISQVKAQKQRIVGILDITFPEYQGFFCSPFTKFSRKLLKKWSTPEKLEKVSVSQLKRLFKGRGRKPSPERMKEMLSSARESIGQTEILDALILQLRLLLEQLEFIERQIEVVEEQIKKTLSQIPQKLTTIPGIGEILAGAIIGEIGDIARFSSKKKLVAYAGLDASVRESGQFVGTRNHISKRGSSYLRKAIWQAAVVSCRFNPKLREFYQKKLIEGKKPMVAQGAIARRLTHIIYAILRTNQDYNPNL